MWASELANQRRAFGLRHHVASFCIFTSDATPFFRTALNNHEYYQQKIHLTTFSVNRGRLSLLSFEHQLTALASPGIPL